MRHGVSQGRMLPGSGRGGHDMHEGGRGGHDMHRGGRGGFGPPGGMDYHPQDDRPPRRGGAVHASICPDPKKLRTVRALAGVTLRTMRSRTARDRCVSCMFLLNVWYLECPCLSLAPCGLRLYCLVGVSSLSKVINMKNTSQGACLLPSVPEIGF